ncbi:G-type lectin S-receptor-like serine/threonine-protein kinase SD3-1 [Telopea speciosissima]|uniref:G-type lectin S-receptor-like serine/threonine-protein kinase SD3-1 n=1 Tax=Telopea speciosissima TaxID=54955 RepID=UPI001CC370B7|nr:G-type lectin S-receptor-like serine/threonine-protein kinase SD3-1 [Telopea speciosissima]
MLERQKIVFNLPLPLCFALGFLFFSVVSSDIPLGSKISVAVNDYWVSSNGDFAFGFFNSSDQPNQYSAGILFNSDSIPVSKRTFVWVVAGADGAVGCNSYLELTQAGDLVLFDSSMGVTVWTSNTSHFSVASAALLDNGNLILQNRDQQVVWQSFKTPSDTLLPGQNFSISETLRAASKNSISSYYSLSMDSSGQLRLRWESAVIYWTGGSGTSSTVGNRASLTSNGALQLLDQRYRPVWTVFGADHNDSSVSFRFLRLDVDGNLRMYSWVKASRSWLPVWQAIPNQCDVFATCGLCGICVFTEAGSTICKCPYGSNNDSNSKCLAPYKPKCVTGNTMIKLEHTSLYGLYPPNDSITHTSLEQCKTSCLNDPLCTSVTVTNDGTAQCIAKQTIYITGYSYPSLRSISFVKKCSDEDPIAVLPPNTPKSSPSSPQSSLFKRSRGYCIPCLIGAASGTLGAFVVIQIGIGLCIFIRRRAIKKASTLAYKGPHSQGLIVFSYTEIQDLTGNFKNRIGSKTFKGMLPDSRPVAIKDMRATITEKQFRGVVSVIGNIHHKNLVKLEGYCCESGHKYLVYEFAKNGSVDKWMEEAKPSNGLTWSKRMETCLGVAKAMAYLHTGCREFVSHGNLNWENVVLDEELVVKVTEFGLGRLCCGTIASTGAAGDIGSFGEMVLVMVSGQRGAEVVSEWAYKEWAEGRAEGVVDGRIEDGVNRNELERALRIAFWCLQRDERMRPSMGEVVMVLDGSSPVDPPPPPFICHRRWLPVEEEGLESDLET